MSTTITDGTTTLTAALSPRWEFSRESGNVIHNIIGSNVPSTTLRPANLRTGTLELVVGRDLALAVQFESLLSSGKRLVLADSDRPTLGGTFVVTGSVALSLHDDDRDTWTVTADVQMVVTV